jgi:hypothetical protein
VDGVYSLTLINFPGLTTADSSVLSSLRETSKDLVRVIEERGGQPVIKYESDFTSLPTIAGLLLSYPAIYYSEDPTAKLLDAEVDVYSIYADTLDRQTLIQFSGPATHREVITKDLEKLAMEWNRRLSTLSPELSAKWSEYIGVESSCILKTHIDTRRVSILTL